MVHARIGLVSSLFIALRAKHSPVANHSLRVAVWASAWGLHYGLREDQLQLFELVGLMHDIGKIGIPDRVLQKPERLNENERAMMELHPQVGTEILRAAGASPELLQCIAAIGSHFESTQNNSTVDPAPMASRLINIIDAYDSMTVRQVYREAMSREAALAELLRLGGTQFDPKLVRTFAEIVLSPRPEIEEKVKQRWLATLPDHEQCRHFRLDDSGTTSTNSRSVSALVQSLNESFFRHMMNHIQHGVIFVDSEYRILDWNNSAERLSGKTAESVFHKQWSPGIVSLCDEEGSPLNDDQCPFRILFQTGEKSRQRHSIKREGATVPLHVVAEVVPVRNKSGAICGGAMILEDISEQAVLEQKIVQLRERASQDQLTKVANRGELNRQLPEFVEHHLRENQSGSVIICDIDYFKRINDNFSHQAGDEALQVFAAVLRDSCREADFVARYGGEEFVMLCSECDIEEATRLAESIREKLHRTPIAALRNSCMTASFGVTTVQPGDDHETVLGRADQGLLIAKESGRDRVVALGLTPTRPTEAAPAKESVNWFGWLGMSNLPALQKHELVSNVPKEVALEKLKGFVREFQAVVVHVDANQAVIEVDCRKAPLPHAKNERLGKFRINVNISELELTAGSNAANVKVCTLLEVEISPVRNRDRRQDTSLNQAMRLKQALQCYLVAHEMDDKIRDAVIRRIKPETDSRY